MSLGMQVHTSIPGMTLMQDMGVTTVHPASKKIRRKRPKKDPRAPKRPRSAYILFCQDDRPKIKQSNPEAKPADIMAIMGEHWKELTEEEQAVYKQRAEQDKQRYEEEMKRYVPGPDYHPDGTAKRVFGKKKRTKDPNEPKRALSSYLFFGQEKRELIKQTKPNAKSPEIMQEIGRMWRELAEEEKEPYAELARKDKERYDQERAAYEKARAGLSAVHEQRQQLQEQARVAAAQVAQAQAQQVHQAQVQQVQQVRQVQAPIQVNANMVVPHQIQQM